VSPVMSRIPSLSIGRVPNVTLVCGRSHRGARAVVEHLREESRGFSSCAGIPAILSERSQLMDRAVQDAALVLPVRGVKHDGWHGLQEYSESDAH